jgi:hypothetical protein
MRGTEPIVIDGVLIGALVPREKGIRFVAVDLRVAEMDQSLWPTIERARDAAREFPRTGRVAGFAPPNLDE